MFAIVGESRYHLGVSVTLRSNSNVVFQCAFRVVWCPVFRHSVIGGRMAECLKELRAGEAR